MPADRDAARDMIASLITQNHGEYVLRIGSQPPHAELFAGGLTDESDGWSGTARNVDEIEKLRQSITDIVEEVGGKVCRAAS